MARKRLRDWPVIVYSYGVMGSFARNEPEWFADEAFTMNRLWNELVVIGRKYLEKYSLDLDGDPRLTPYAEERDRLKAEIDELTERIKKLRQKLRTRKHPSIAELQERKRELQTRRREVNEKYREIKATLKEEYKHVWKEMEEEINRKLKEFYPKMYWGNWEVVRDRFWTAWRKVKQGTPPRFHRFDGNWTMNWRYAGGGVPVPNLLGRVLDRFPPEEAYSLPTRKRAKNTLVTATLRMKGKVVQVPFIMHRPMPEEGVVKRIQLVRREYGPDGFHKWFINFTVEVPPERYVELVEPKKSFAILEIGFRKVGEGKIEVKMPVECEDGRIRKIRVERPTEYIRVGVLYDGENLEEIHLPEKVVAKWLLSIEKQARADRILQELKDDLWNFFVEEGIKDRLPEELRKLFLNRTTWGRVRKKGLKKLARGLQEAGLFEDVAEEIWETLRRWSRMVGVASRMRKKAVSFRNKFYENLAARLYREYERVLIAQIDLKELAREERSEDLPKKARFQRFMAGLSVLAGTLERKAERVGGGFEKVELPYKTRRCHVCGTVNEPTDPARLEWVCEGCGKRWDVDHNAVMNLWQEVAKKAA